MSTTTHTTDAYGTYQTYSQREAARAKLEARIAAPHAFKVTKREPTCCALCGYARTAQRHNG